MENPLSRLSFMSLGAAPGACMSHEEIRVQDYHVAGSKNLFSKPTPVALDSQPSFTPIIVNDEPKSYRSQSTVAKTVEGGPVDSTIPWFMDTDPGSPSNKLLCYRTIVLVEGNKGYSPEELRLRDYRSGVAKPLKPPYPQHRPFPSNREFVCKPFSADAKAPRQAAITEEQQRVNAERQRVEDGIPWFKETTPNMLCYRTIVLVKGNEGYSPEELRFQHWTRRRNAKVSEPSKAPDPSSSRGTLFRSILFTADLNGGPFARSPETRPFA